MGTEAASCFSEQTVISGGAATDTAYCIFFTLDASNATNTIDAGCMLQGRIRRIAASGSEVDGEVAVWDWVTLWETDKVYGPWVVEENVS